MIYRTHAAFGAALMESVLVGEGAFSWQAGAAVAIAALVAVIPDVDHPQSWITLHVDPLRLVSRTFRHRTATHSLLSILFGYVLLFQLLHLPPWVASGIWVGWTSHALIDLLNPQGVMLFWPMPTPSLQKRLHWNGFIRNPVPLLTIPVQSLGEEILERLLLFYAMALGVLWIAAHIIVSLPFSRPLHRLLWHGIDILTWPFLVHIALWLHIRA
ncbi:metal-dependent hydrolase [Alicyclobacillus tolerans]|uniref:Inner membrane protein n=1 Tax=Alicyclobacillus tolerans TaxID=90970 RepID=A0A1M6YQC9_9BACL|nr:metal-dependent hydrolase [Alicyclobacillus montanus]SHL20239.1 inner membrane protein [Alicyclobacillus montanus]